MEMSNSCTLHEPQKTFNWPQGGDSCYVSIKNVVCAIQASTTTTRRTYRICDEGYDKTIAAFAKLHSKILIGAYNFKINRMTRSFIFR